MCAKYSEIYILENLEGPEPDPPSPQDLRLCFKLNADRVWEKHGHTHVQAKGVTYF